MSGSDVYARTRRQYGASGPAGQRDHRDLQQPTAGRPGCELGAAHCLLPHAAARLAAGSAWQDLDLVFASAVGTQRDAANVQRACRGVVKAAGLDPAEWTFRELRHSFVSLLSDAGLPLEHISRLVGPQRDSGHRGGLSQADPADPHRRRRDDGPDLLRASRPRGRRGCVVTHLVTQSAERPFSDRGKGLVTCVGVAGFEPTTSSSRTVKRRSSRST
jgi:Phage integrase family